ALRGLLGRRADLASSKEQERSAELEGCPPIVLQMMGSATFRVGMVGLPYYLQTASSEALSFGSASAFPDIAKIVVPHGRRPSLCGVRRIPTVTVCFGSGHASANS